MPTTCGFPNCKFRSRYRGADDNRHFYRVPKKPPILRERWLQAIGRTEDTIVNQGVSSTLGDISTTFSPPPSLFVHVVVVRTDATAMKPPPLSVFSTTTVICHIAIPTQSAQTLKLQKVAKQTRRRSRRRRTMKEQNLVKQFLLRERNR